MSRQIKTHKHVLTFEGQLPADEMDRANMYAANPGINEARVALQKALADAGYPHETVSHVVRPRQIKDKAAE